LLAAFVKLDFYSIFRHFPDGYGGSARYIEAELGPSASLAPLEIVGW